jgi:glycosyltransferase involved in cell wall biosynthesis
LKILEVNTYDAAGGAERVVEQLADEFRARGHDCWRAVGFKRTNARDVYRIDNDRLNERWRQVWMSRGASLRKLVGRGVGASRLVPVVEERIAPGFEGIAEERGYQPLNFPGTWRLLGLTPEPPDLVHCHNLHGPFLHQGGYFDLRALPWLSAQVPVVITLHDSWLLTGHCAHSFDCERWRIGCGRCPDLAIYPAVKRDATDVNWARKNSIYERAALFVATPCRWLEERVERSMLASAVIESRVIPNGIDLDVFHPQRDDERHRWGFEASDTILMTISSRFEEERWRDPQMAVDAFSLLRSRYPDLKLIVVGGAGSEPERDGDILRLPFQRGPSDMARIFRAADLYLHPARADTFPNAVIEALACGTPVVAPHVGGIPEQIIDVGSRAGRHATGSLATAANAAAMADAVSAVLEDPLLLAALSENASRDAAARFDMRRQADEYLEWFEELVEVRQAIGS